MLILAVFSRGTRPMPKKRNSKRAEKLRAVRLPRFDKMSLHDFIEHMPVFETYVPDLQPEQVDARTRGLAQVCLVLFNLNEFAYLD